MVQKITIDCSTCENIHEEQTEKCIVIMWRKDAFGIGTHDVNDEDIIFALRELTKKITIHMDHSLN